MKVLLVSSLYYPLIVGGAEVSTQLLAESLVRYYDLEVHVLTTGESDCDEVVNKVYVHRRRMTNIYSFWKFKHESNFGSRVIYKFLDFYSYANKAIIRTILQDINPDIVHVNNIYGFSPVIWSVPSSYGIPVINTYRDYFMMCPRANLMSNGKICNNPNVACRIYRNLFKHFLKPVAIHVAISKAVQRVLYDTLQIESEVIYNSIDVDYDLFQRCYENKKNHKKGTVKFVYVGGLIPTKGVLELSKEFARMNEANVELHILGEGILRGEIEQLECKDIILHGFVSGEEKKAILSQMDVAICPSLWNEPFGRVVIEAYQYALPVIGSAMGGIPELIGENTGMLFDPYEPKMLANTLHYYAKEWDGLSEASFQEMKELLKKFDIQKQVESYYQLYRELIKG